MDCSLKDEKLADILAELNHIEKLTSSTKESFGGQQIVSHKVHRVSHAPRVLHIPPSRECYDRALIQQSRRFERNFSTKRYFYEHHGLFAVIQLFDNIF